MAREARLNIRLEKSLKSEVDLVLQKLGLSASEVINALYAQIKLRQAIPFEIAIPGKKISQELEQELKAGYIANAESDLQENAEWNSINFETWPD